MSHDSNEWGFDFIHLTGETSTVYSAQVTGDDAEFDDELLGLLEDTGCTWVAFSSDKKIVYFQRAQASNETELDDVKRDIYSMLLGSNGGLTTI